MNGRIIFGWKVSDHDIFECDSLLEERFPGFLTEEERHIIQDDNGDDDQEIGEVMARLDRKPIGTIELQDQVVSLIQVWSYDRYEQEYGDFVIGIDFTGWRRNQLLLLPEILASPKFTLLRQVMTEIEGQDLPPYLIHAERE